MRININKTYSAINVIGLALGLSGVIIITLFLNYEFNYDTWHPQLQRVYRITALNNTSSATAQDEWNDKCDARVAFALRNQLPQAQAVTGVINTWDKQIAMQAGGKAFMQDNVLMSDSMFFSVFPYTFVSGNSTLFAQPNSIVLSEETSHKLFNSTDVAGKIITIKMYDAGKPQPYMVAGVVRQPSSPTLVGFNALMHQTFMDKAPAYAGEHAPTKIFMLMRAGISLRQTAQQTEKIYNATLDAWAAQMMQQIHIKRKDKRYEHGIQLQALQDAHLHPLGEKSLVEKMAPLIALSFLLLIIAIVNFANLSIAQASFKAKEVVIRKISGAGATHLIMRFLWQAVVKCIIAFALAGALAWLLQPVFNATFNIPVSFFGYINVMQFAAQALGILVITALLAGLYPAIYITGYKPLKVLRGDIKRAAGNFSLRNALVVLQFVIAIIFIVAIGVMGSQLHYMAHADIGFKPQGLIHIKSSENPQLVERIKNIPGVIYAGQTSQTMGDADAVKIDVFYNGDSSKVNFTGIDYETMQAMHVKLLQGRLFSRQYGADSINTIIVNKTTAAIMGGDVVGKWIYLGSYNYRQQIVGVIDDYHYQGFDKQIAPTIYTINANYGHPGVAGILVYAGNNAGSIIPQIQKIWNGYYAGYPFQYSYVTDEYSALLAQYNRMQSVFNTFSIIALALSLMGLFALTAYIVQQRVKEIGIRKVLGATAGSILQLINTNYFLLILASNIIAWPIATILLRNWLNGFVYRINMPLMPFIAAFFASIILAVLTVSIQAWRAALANPVEALRAE